MMFWKKEKTLREKDFVNRGPDSSFKERNMDVPKSKLSWPFKFCTPLGSKTSERNVDSISPSPLPTSSCSVPSIRCVKIQLNENGSFAPCDPKFEKGTTAFGFTFDDGIMICINHSKPAKNVVVLNPHMLATISGGSEFLLQDLQKMCNKKEQEEGRETSIAEAVKWLTDALSVYQEKLPIGILIAAGNNSELGMYRIDQRGVVADHVLGIGSGSCFSYPLEEPRPNRNMSRSEATKLAKETICMAAIKAPHSADFFSVYHLGRKGCKKVFEGGVETWRQSHPKYFRNEIEKYVVIGPGW